MRATLIHNPTAGSGQPSAELLVDWLGDAGYTVRYASSKRKGFLPALEEPSDVIVVAGGDGTVAKVATRLVGWNMPLAILPLGTSNNIASALGVRGAPEEIIHGLPSAGRRWLDAATASAPWGVTRFVESAGVGLFAAMLEHAEQTAEHRGNEESGEDRLAPSVRGTQRALERQRSRFYRVEADGEDLSGRYVMAVAMNIKRIGSTLELAPDADTGDGKLDLVLLKEEDRTALGEYLERLAHEEQARFPLAPKRVTVVRIGWNVPAGHLDDERWPIGEIGGISDQEPPFVELAIVDEPIPVLVANVGGP